MSQIMESKDYGMFEKHIYNRAIRKIAPLISSMEKYGFIDAYPILSEAKSYAATAICHLKSLTPSYPIEMRLSILDSVIAWIEKQKENIRNEKKSKLQEMMCFYRSGGKGNGNGYIRWWCKSVSCLRHMIRKNCLR